MTLWECREVNPQSLGWFKGKITGNHGFYMFLPSNWSGFPVNFPIIQFYDSRTSICWIDEIKMNSQWCLHDYWLVAKKPSWKNTSQWERLSHILWKIKKSKPPTRLAFIHIFCGFLENIQFYLHIEPAIFFFSPPTNINKLFLGNLASCQCYQLNRKMTHFWTRKFSDKATPRMDQLWFVNYPLVMSK